MYRILICDDAAETVGTLRKTLTEEGFAVDTASSLQQALELMEQKSFQLIILNDAEQDANGINTLEALRKRSDLPVILLSEKSSEEDVIRGLNAGADDYITKPCGPLLVAARARAQLRRCLQPGGGKLERSQIRIGGVSIDDVARTVSVDGQTVSLTPLEYDILRLLMLNPGTIYSSKEIYRMVWKERPMGAENAVAVHIRHIREKIEKDPADPKYLKVAWGKGYQFQPG